MNELQRINAVLTEAYTREELARLVRLGLDVDLESITTASDKRTIVFQLVNWAQRNNRIHELLAQAKEQSPSNQPVQDLTYTPKSEIYTPKKRVNRSKKLSMGEHEQLAYLIHKVEQIERDLEKIKNIVVGPNWGNGLQSVSMDNSRKLEELLSRIERQPDMLSSTRTKLFFYTMFALLLLSVFMLAGGRLGWV